MAATKRTPSQVAADLVLIEQLRVKGWELRAIAAHIAEVRPYRISFQQVHQELKKIEKAWQEAKVELRHQAKARLLAEINAVRAAAWRMLEESAKELVRVRADLQGASAEEAAARPPVRITRENAPRYGDPAILRVILDCNRREAELMGVDAATHFKLSAAEDTAQPLGTDTKVVLYLPRKQPAIDIEEVKPAKKGKL